MKTQTKHSLMLMLCAFIWGTAFVAQSAGSGMGAYSFLAGRSWLAVLVLIPTMFAFDAVRKKQGQPYGWPKEKSERKTLLVELDSGLRSVDIIAGVYGRTVYDIEDVLCGRCEGAKAVVPSPLYPGLSVISAPYEGGAVEAAPLGRLLTAMRPYFDFILLDTAAGMGAPFTAASTVADKALLVLTPDPVALRDGKIVADRLLAGGRPQSAVRLVMNRVRRESFGKNAAVADLDECIDTVGVQLLAVIPESRVLQLAGANGTVPPAADPAVVAGQAMAKRLCGQRVPLTF